MSLYDFYKALKEPDKFIWDFCRKDNYKNAHLVPDKLYLKCMYKRFMGEKLNLKNPVGFNEKLQWLKLYDRRPEYPELVDKVSAKQYIAKKLGSEYVIPTVGVYDSADEIPFDKLPDRFVMKCTHDSGSTVLCRDKNALDIEQTKQKLTKMVNRPFYWYGREWPYKSVKKRIIIERALFDKNGNGPIDYKFFCFDGKMRFVQVDFGRFVDRRSNYYGRDLKIMQFHKQTCPYDPNIEFEKPAHFDRMIEIAEKLSEGIPFLRVDLYCVEDRIYFGEMTFFPGSGCLRLVSDQYDAEKYVGDMIKLPKKRR